MKCNGCGEINLFGAEKESLGSWIKKLTKPGHSYNHEDSYDPNWEQYWQGRPNLMDSREWYITFANRKDNIDSKCLECQLINLRWIVLGIKVGFME